MIFIPMGDGQNQRYKKVLRGLNGTTIIVDDILIDSETFEGHVDYIRGKFSGYLIDQKEQ